MSTGVFTSDLFTGLRLIGGNLLEGGGESGDDLLSFHELG
jgi:hypothetical protein